MSTYAMICPNIQSQRSYSNVKICDEVIQMLKISCLDLSENKKQQETRREGRSPSEMPARLNSRSSRSNPDSNVQLLTPPALYMSCKHQ